MSSILIGTAVKKKSDKEKVATQQRMDKENLFSTSEKEKINKIKRSKRHPQRIMNVCG